MHRTVPTTENHPAPNVTGAEPEDPWLRDDRGVLFNVGVRRGPWQGTFEHPKGSKGRLWQRAQAQRPREAHVGQTVWKNWGFRPEALEPGGAGRAVRCRHSPFPGVPLASVGSKGGGGGAGGRLLASSRQEIREGLNETTRDCVLSVYLSSCLVLCAGGSWRW